MLICTLSNIVELKCTITQRYYDVQFSRDVQSRIDGTMYNSAQMCNTVQTRARARDALHPLGPPTPESRCLIIQISECEMDVITKWRPAPAAPLLQPDIAIELQTNLCEVTPTDMKLGRRHHNHNFLIQVLRIMKRTGDGGSLVTIVF